MVVVVLIVVVVVVVVVVVSVVLATLLKYLTPFTMSHSILSRQQQHCDSI